MTIGRGQALRHGIDIVLMDFFLETSNQSTLLIITIERMQLGDLQPWIYRHIGECESVNLTISFKVKCQGHEISRKTKY